MTTTRHQREPTSRRDKAVSTEKVGSRGRIRRRIEDEPSPVKTYDVPWMWSWLDVRPSEWQEFPIEDLGLDYRRSLATGGNSRSLPEGLVFPRVRVRERHTPKGRFL